MMKILVAIVDELAIFCLTCVPRTPLSAYPTLKEDFDQKK